MKKLILALFALITLPVAVAAQPQVDTTGNTPEIPATQPVRETVVVMTLFEYPTAPEDLPDIKARCNWVMEHFWDKMDFSQNAVSQAALDHAFGVWVAPMRWADEAVSTAAFDNLIKKISKSPTLLLQFTKAAEHNLYGDKADIWIDAPYLKFVDALLANKKIPELRKGAYKAQKAQLEKSMIGIKMPVFNYETTIGDKGKLSIETPYTIVVFGDPFCSDCSMYKVKLDADKRIADWIADGKLSLYYIVPDGESVEDWQRQLVFYPSAWKRGAGSGLDEIYDIRRNPSVYLLDDKGVIIMKFPSPEELANFIDLKLESLQ